MDLWKSLFVCMCGGTINIYMGSEAIASFFDADGDDDGIGCGVNEIDLVCLFLQFIHPSDLICILSHTLLTPTLVFSRVKMLIKKFLLTHKEPLFL